jgi:ABC-type arginine transport system permease subunit
MPLDPGADAPDDLSHAGSVVDKAIEYMIEQGIAPISVASALLGGALGMLSRSMDDRAVAQVLRSALASVEAGELEAMRADDGPAATAAKL